MDVIITSAMQYGIGNRRALATCNFCQLTTEMQLQLMPKLLRRSTEDVSLETEQIASDCQAGVDIANILNE